MLGAAALGGASALPMPVLAQDGTARRSFTIRGAGMNLGRQINRVTREGSRLTSEVEIDIDVKLLGVRLYSYRMENREEWVDGELISIEAETIENQDDRDFVQARRTSRGLEVNGSKFDGVITDQIATTTYWTKAFLDRQLWLSTQGGEQYQVAFGAPTRTTYRTGEGEVEATRYRVLGDLELSLYYDLNREWIGTSFRVQGRNVRISADELSQPLAPLWFTA